MSGFAALTATAYCIYPAKLALRPTSCNFCVLTGIKAFPPLFSGDSLMPKQPHTG